MNLLEESLKAVNFILVSIRTALTGSRRYYLWLAALLVTLIFSTITYLIQIDRGIIITGARAQMHWGLYIAQFPFFVGLAAGGVMVVIPAYIYNREDFRQITIFGELLAVAAVVMSLAGILTMLGRLDRLWHMIPPMGIANFPQSMLPWDALVLNGYLFLNLLIPGYLLYREYYGEEPGRWINFFIYLSIPWAISIHTVTAFILSATYRASWHTALMAPRFLASAFVVGPAFIIVVIQIVMRYTDINSPASHLQIKRSSVFTLGHIVTIALLVNLFFIGAELFTVFYTSVAPEPSFVYAFFGLEKHGHLYNMYVPYTWGAIGLELVAAFILLNPRWFGDPFTLNIACFLAFTGILVEKGVILVITGLIPTPLGEIWEFVPTMPEIVVTIGIWALGLLIFTLLAKVAIDVESGKVRDSSQEKGAEKSFYE